MHGMLIAVALTRSKQQAARSTQHAAHIQPVARVRSQETRCRGDGINFEGEPHDLGSAPAIRECSSTVCLALGSALAHMQKHMADTRPRSRFCWLLAARRARFCTTGQRDRPSSTGNCR